MSDTTRMEVVGLDAEGVVASTAGPTLVIAWSREEPHRLGDCARLSPGRTALLGRGDTAHPGEEPLVWVRQRPGDVERRGPLRASTLSRRQLLLTLREDRRLEVECVGRAPLYFRGARTDAALVTVGDTLRLGQGFVVQLQERPDWIPEPRSWDPERSFAFGSTDPFGMVGESPLFWEQREQLAFCARRPAHVLITGESGTGKELAARALHGMSARASGPLVARNAATIPGSLIDAELFGNAKNYPNPGMKERQGLVGEADGGTLFLDEIGELPVEHQAHLLRVLDGGGEYQRLGETRARRSDFRLVAATNRDLGAIKHDLLARMVLRVELEPLHRRPSDVPLLARHLLHRIARDNPDVRARFFDPTFGPRVEGALIEALLAHTWTTHARELERLLWMSLSASRGDTLALTRRLREVLGAGADSDRSLAPGEEPTEAMIRESLERHDWVQNRVWKELGLKNRFQLRRLIQKYGIEIPGRDDTTR